MKAWLQGIVERVRNEPVMVSVLVIAVGNILGADLSEFSTLIETVAIFALGGTARHFVTPTRKL